MIVIPENFQNSAFCDKSFKELVSFFNELEKKLEYPNCDGNEDAIRILKIAQSELIMWGKV